MGRLFDKLKKSALKAGMEAQKNPRLLKTAMNVKEAVEAFREGYAENRTEEEETSPGLCSFCRKKLPPDANFCPNCGSRTGRRK